MLTTPTFSQGLCKGSFHRALAQGPPWFSNLGDRGKDLVTPPLDLGFFWILLGLRGLDKQGHLRVHAPALRPFSQGRPRTGPLLSQIPPGHVSAGRRLSSLGFISGILVFISQPPSLNACLCARHPVPKMTAERLENMCV